MPIGIYKHKPQQGFQRGHIDFVPKEGRLRTSQKLRGVRKSTEHRKNIALAKIGNDFGKHGRGIPRLMLRGEGNPNWKGGNTPENVRIRYSMEYSAWVKSCMTRDAFTCQKCMKIGWQLEVHHIRNFAEAIDLRFSLDNGVTLCKKDHRQFHKIYGRKNNNLEQLKEWMRIL